MKCDLDALVVDLDDVIRRRHRATHPHGGDGARVYDPHPGDTPDVGDVPVAREDHVHFELTQDGHNVARVAQVVHVAARTRDGEDVVVDHEYPRTAVPAAELRVEPAVVLAPDLSLVEVGLGRVERHHLGDAFRDGDLGRALPDAEELLEVPVADVLGIVVAHRVDDVRALQLVEVLSGLLEFPTVAFHSQVPDDGNEVRLERVTLLDGGLKEILPEQPGAHVHIRHLYYSHAPAPSRSCQRATRRLLRRSLVSARPTG